MHDDLQDAFDNVRFESRNELSVDPENPTVVGKKSMESGTGKII